MSKLHLMVKVLTPLMLLPALTAAFLTSKILITVKKWSSYFSPDIAAMLAILLLVIFNYPL